jgi:hypothetical protein
VRADTLRGALAVAAICAGTVAWAGVGGAGVGAACGCEGERAGLATAGTGSAAFSASGGTLLRADARGAIVRRATALTGSPRSGPPSVWLAAGDGRLRAGAHGTVRAFGAVDLAPLGRSLRLFPGGGQGPIAVAAHAVWAIERFGGAVRGADPLRPQRIWSIPVGRGTAGLVADAGTLYVSLVRTAAGGPISRRAAPAVVAIDAATRRVIWRRSLDFDPLLLAVGRSGVWVAGGRRGDLVALGRERGRVLARTRLDRPAVDLAATAGGVLALTDGGVLAVARDGATAPTAPIAPRRGAALAVGGGSAWLAGADGALTRLGPGRQ